MEAPVILDRHSRVRRRLSSLAQQTATTRARLGVLLEQVAFLEQVESDAAVDAVVGGDPVTGREHRSARSDLDRARREQIELTERLDALSRQQDALLERLLD